MNTQIKRYRASIDLGTNTCLLLILAQGPSGETTVLKDEMEIVRLGEGVDATQNFQPHAMERSMGALARYQKILNSFQIFPSEVVCVATSQARQAQNADVFFSKIKKEIGFQFQILSGSEEARFSFLGATSGDSQSVVLDIGGGSTEITTAETAHSLEMGSVRFMERFLKSNPVQKKEVQACQDEIQKILVSYFKDQNTNNALSQKKWIGVAGVATTLGAVLSQKTGEKGFNPEKINQMILEKNDLWKWIQRLETQTIEERIRLYALHPLRADSILSGSLILWHILDFFQVSFCHVSTRGLRYGILLDRI